MIKSGSNALGGYALLVDLCRTRAATQPEDLAYRFLVSGDIDGEIEHWTFGDVDHRARAVAASLQAVCAPGERALLLYPPGLNFIAAFMGCLYAGVVAVPTYPPDLSRIERTLPRLRTIAADAGARVVLTTTPVLGMAELLGHEAPELAALHWLATDSPSDELAAAFRAEDLSGDTVAFLQYTSGSTSEPKGVMVTHANILHNEQLIALNFEHDESSHGVGWLPMFHDMGLIGNVLQPLYFGFACTLMSPLAFLQRPSRWLEAISHFRGTTSGGPNFDYELCARKVTERERARLDLSTWKLAFNGAEPVRAQTIQRFSEAFAGSGFRRDAFYPCYGLAESTLLVTGGRRGAAVLSCAFDAAALGRARVVEAQDGFEGARTLVSSGASGRDLQVIIVDPETRRRAPEDHVGEIWVSGPSVARGYWGRPEETERTFRAHLSDTGEGPFLRTGDLGFLRSGQLYVAGRLKDLVIIRGRNHYPQDIEQTIERAHRDIRPGCSAAFSMDDGGNERLAVAAEVDLRGGEPDTTTIIASIRRAIAEEHAVHAHAVLLLAPRTIAKTSSGKIQRHAVRAGFLAGSLEIVARSESEELIDAPPPAAIDDAHASIRDALSALPREARLPLLEQWIRGELARLLRVDPERVQPRASLWGLGLDSLMMLEFKEHVESALGTSLPAALWWRPSTAAELSAQLLEQGAPEAVPDLAVGPAPDLVPLEGEVPVSSGQRRLWFLDRLVPGSALYNVHFGVRIEGELDTEALKRSLDEIVARHDALRAAFLEVDGEPRQLIRPPVPLDTPVVDLRAIPEAERGAELERLSAALGSRPFDLSNDLLFRTTLVILGDREHLLWITQHHIVTDGWSVSLLFRELVALYQAFADGRPAPLRSPRRLVAGAALPGAPTGEELEALRAFWQERLAGLAPLALPLDRPRPRVPAHRGAIVSFACPRDLGSALETLGRRADCTLFVTLLSAWVALLHRYSGQLNFAVGTVVAGRDRPELRDTVGFLASTLVLRCDLAGAPAFDDLLRRMRNVVADAFAHGELPFDEVVEVARATRDGGDNPLFQASFMLESLPAEMAVGPTTWRPELPTLDGSVQGTAKFDLGLVMAKTPDGLRGAVEYSTDLFDDATIRRLVGHFEALLLAVVMDPARRMGEIPLLTGPERLQIASWNDTRIELPEKALAHELFEAAVERAPEATAAVFEGRSITYRALDRRARRLARRLRALGIGPERRVGVAVGRSLEMLIAIVGTLQAGGAYVPIDPTYPAERVTFMIADAGLSALIVDGSAEPPRLDEGTVLFRLDAAEDDDEGDEPRLPRTSTGESLAYMIYTSGSTGRPKGVQIPHRALANLLFAMRARPAIAPGDRLLALTTLSFDIAGLELLLPLTVGASVEIASREVAADGAALRRHIEERRPTIVQATPSTWRMLVEAGWSGSEGIEILCGGEALGRDLAALLGDRCGSLWNMYGPTETTIWSAVHRVEAGDGPVPIGPPITNTRFHVLDANLELAPVGVPGELYIGGLGLARGYWRRAALTAERFIPSPFHRDPGERLYRTGDLVRWRPDGTLEFLGRADHQVKIRGHRIELGEIEAALERYPLVRAAAVTASEDAQGDRRLVAHVAARGEARPTAAELRSHLQSSLPDYMIPVAFLVLEDLPLTPNGKIDRGALPVPGDLRGEGPPAAAPRTPIEDLLKGIWEEVLGCGAVGINDDFFDLGGHSLAAVRVLARVRRATGTDLPVRVLFEAPTIARLGEAITRARRRGAARPPLTRTARGPESPASYAQQRLWFLTQLEPDSPSYNIPAAMRVQGPLDAGTLEQSIREVMARHEALRTTFALRDGRVMQVISAEPSLGVTSIDLRARDAPTREAEASRLAADEAARPFDPARGPLVRAALFRLDDEDHLVVLTLHHLVADGWSMGVLVRELCAHHERLTGGAPAPLPELSIQYADHASWQRQWLSNEVQAGQLAYWVERLAGAPSLLELPISRPRPAVRSSRGATRIVRIPRALCDGLRELGRREGATLFMTLLAAFQALLHRHSGQDDLVVGTPVAGRAAPEVEDLIGLFVNTLALRADLSGDPTFLELLSQARASTLDAHAHEDVPFEAIIDALRLPRDPSRPPLFQAMFVLQNAPLSAPRFGDLTLRRVPIETGTAKFDLTLALEDVDGALEGTLEYSTDLFDDATIARMGERFEALLRAVEAAPNTRVSAIPILGEDELRQLLSAWNETSVPLPRQQCVHELFEAQAATTPEALAVIAGEERLTYAALDARANQLAHYLGALGVGPEVTVGLCLERSTQLLVAVLGVLKAGGAYVPVDPSYPAERLGMMIDDARMPVILTEQRLTGELPATRAHLLCLDTEGARLAGQPTEAPLRRAGPENLAYIMYTSGSTGRPKGVMIPHRGLVNYLSWCTQAYATASGQGAPVHSSIGFDLTVTSLFSPLLSGRAVTMVAEDRPIEGLLSALRGGNHGLVKLTPSHLTALCALEDSAADPWGARVFVLGGEELNRQHVDALRARAPGARIINESGPTETVVGCCVHEVLDLPAGAAPIGRPIANTRLYVLDRQMRPAPIGVGGELYIGGEGVARGYHGRPAATAGSFVPDPFSNDAGARLYRSGDRARFRDDGVLEFLGRLDDQVKLRGHRIELGEIEAALRAHPRLCDAVAMVREDTPGNRRIVAYVVPSPDAEVADVDEADLRAHLERRLPVYMMPASLVVMSALPLSRHGKVDRKALPAPDMGRPEGAPSFVAPRTPAEEILAGIIADVLGLPRVGAHDNFFALGGDSILAIRVVGKASQAGLGLSVRAFLQHQTVARIAAAIEHVAPPIKDVSPAMGSVSLTPIQRWLFEQERVDPHHFNQAILLQSSERLDPHHIEEATRILVSRHDALRLAFIHEGAAIHQRLVTPAASIFLHVDLSATPPGEEAEAIESAAAKVQESLRLDDGTLARVALFDLGKDRPARLLFVVHHLAVDGVSWRILLEEMQIILSQLRSGDEVRLSPTTTPFTRWAERLAAHAQSDEWLRALPHWLAGSAPAPLPVDQPGGAGLMASARTVETAL
ncbi:MAG TPA: amino acid adenylation domain-containing protein, partial [Candidatus Nanopelagicales bacterium]|nr:amino acid adenylation domain-containing protein [Candidatus Nanopelagicales bacterium]